MKRRIVRSNAPSSIDNFDAANASSSATDAKSWVHADDVERRIPLLAEDEVKENSSEGGGAATSGLSVDVYKDGHIKLNAPATPWHELDLSDSFLAAMHTSPYISKAPKSIWRKRCWFFLFGGLLGVFLGWLFTEGDPLSSLNGLDLDVLSSFDLHSLIAEIPSLPSMNVTEILSPGKDWLNSKTTNFKVGREAAARGLTKKDCVIIIPGIVSSGLESWSTTPIAAPFFRKRIWASTSMLRAIITNKDAWVAAMSLDPETGLDPLGQKVRAAQGLDAASSFMPGYWIWQKVIENLAVLDYDHADLELFAYDWRLSYYNLEVRDQYFSRLKTQIDYNLAISGKKTALLAHSMGSLVVLWFFKWVEAPEFGNGGPHWVEDHISSFVNIAGTLLGVPKAMSALLSGEMRDTVEINAAGVYLLEKFFSRSERAKLFRSWAGATSMMLKGGNAVWGDHESAPDDPPNAALSGGKIYYFRPEVYDNTTMITSETTNPNLTIDAATSYILNHVPPAYQRMMGSNYSFGIERDPEQLAKNDGDHRMWTNPLESRLPNAPSLNIYCLYGTGKETERAYWYQQGGYERDEAPQVVDSVCIDMECAEQTPRTPLDMPLSRRVWIDSTVNLESQVPKVRSGVVFGEGDGTVSLLSLGAMCVDGWKRDLYNPGRARVITHEIKHDPLFLDPRGGPTTADHVDILGSSEMNEALMDIVSGNGDRVQDVFHSNVKEYASKIKWDAD